VAKAKREGAPLAYQKNIAQKSKHSLLVSSPDQKQTPTTQYKEKKSTEQIKQ